MEKSDCPPSCDFKMFQRFHFFYYSKKDDQTFLLLRKKSKSKLFSELCGKVTELDPGVLFAAARKTMQLSAGLLLKQNLRQFDINSPDQEICKENLQTCKPTLDIPQMMNNRAYQSFIEDTFQSSIPYQNQSHDAYYFVELPYINISKLHDFCNENGINIEVSYRTRQEILDENSTDIDPKSKRIFDNDLNNFVEKYIEKGDPIPIRAHYAVLVIYTTPTNYRMMGILGSNFKKFGEEWKVYKFPLEEPTEEEMGKWNGMLIPGANVCAYDRGISWREKIIEMIRLVYQRYTKCKILGICYGIQILAEAFGGKCDKLPEMLKGSAPLEICSKFWELSYIKELGIQPKNHLLITESHNDIVTECPQNCEVYASSKACPIEILGIGNRCLAFQGHPEINEAWTACLLYQMAKRKEDFKKYHEEIKKTYFQEKLEHELWMKITYSFLKSKCCELKQRE